MAHNWMLKKWHLCIICEHTEMMQNEPCFSIRVLLMGTRWFKWREVECMREVHRGCRETVAGDFCFDFCDPKRGFADPARVARGWKQGKGATEKGHTHHTRNGIQHARNSPLWKYGKECPTNMASGFQAHRPWKKTLEHLNRKVNSKVAGLFYVGEQEYQNYSLGNKFCGGLKCWNYSGSANKYCGGKWKYRNYNGGGNKLAIFVRRLGLGWVCVFVSGA